MSCFFHKLSAGFLAWLLMVALFADGVNLDDLLPGTFVIHDSDDTVQSILVSSSRDRNSSRDLLSHTQQVAPASRQHASRSIRIVFDEDSPSEAAGPLGSDVVAIAPVIEDQPASVTGNDAVGLLHLLNCTLLI